jgi:hypothetical protein
MENELKIRIVNDSKGNKLNLENITIEAAESLKIFLDSLAGLANTYGNSSEFKISLKDGSVESTLVFPTTNNQVASDINAVFSGQSRDMKKIRLLKQIQDKVKQNGLSYDILWKVNDIEENITQIFKGTNFTYKRDRQKGYDETVFLKGRLIKIGGEPNSHLYVDANGTELRVQCSVEQAVNIKIPLYHPIFISAVKTNYDKYKPSYRLIDSYVDNDEISEIQQMLYSISQTKSLDRFDFVHEKIYELIQADRLETLKHIIIIFNTIHTERGILRTLLMSIKPIMKNEAFSQLKPLYNSLAETLRAGSTHNTI